MRNLFTLNPKVSTALFTLIGFILIEDFSTLEQNVVGNWLMLTAQVVITNASSQQLIENYASNSGININDSDLKNIYNPLFYDIENLKTIIRNMQPNEMQNIFNDLHNRLSKIEQIITEMYNNNV